MKIKESVPDRIFLTAIHLLFALVIVVCVYPLYYCIVISLNEGQDALRAGIYFWPRMFTLDNYRAVFKDSLILDAYFITVMRTVVGTIAVVLFNAIFAYALSRNELKFRKVYIYIGMFTMYFWGGIIPLYILLRTIGLLNSFWVHILPNLSGFFTILIFIAFFREIPESIIESARIDGANEFLVLVRIVLPMSTAVLATIALFAAVGHWNSWIESYLYISNPKLQTLPYLLVRMINQGLAEERMRSQGLMMAWSANTSTITANSIRLATMIVAIVPIMLSYPFLQKYFVKGMMIGAVKG